MRNTKIYLANSVSALRAWLRLGLCNPDLRLLLAAKSMRELNCIARSSKWKDSIYELKRHFVRYLYESGYCISAAKQRQVQKCWHTWSYLCGSSDTCAKCNNTGIYREHILYNFAFIIAGDEFHWHQPENQVDYRIALDKQEADEYQEVLISPKASSDGEIYEMLNVVRFFLVSRGLTLPNEWSLANCLRTDLSIVSFNAQHCFRKRIVSLTNAILKRAGVKNTSYVYDDDDIPF